MATTESQNKVLAPKDPDTRRAYGVSVADIKPDGATLASAQVTAIVPSGGLTVFGAASLPTAATVSGDRAYAQFVGGVANTTYEVTFEVTYSDGTNDQITVIIPVRQK